MSAVSLVPFVDSGKTKGEARPIDLLISDDSSMHCELLKNALTHPRSPFNVLASAVSQAEILSHMHSHALDVALISESLQDGPLTGFSVLHQLKESFPNTKVIVLLRSESDELVVDAFRGGARGVFCRAEPLQTLCKCIQAVYEGQTWANSRQLRSVLDAFTGAAPLHLVKSNGLRFLTKREMEVVKLVVDGHTNRDVAQRLGLTEHTVSNYLFRIYEKLGISSRVELVLYSLKGHREPLP